MSAQRCKIIIDEGALAMGTVACLIGTMGVLPGDAEGLSDDEAKELGDLLAQVNQMGSQLVEKLDRQLEAAGIE